MDSNRALNPASAQSMKKSKKSKKANGTELTNIDTTAAVPRDMESHGDEIEYEQLASSSRHVLLILLCIFVPCIGIVFALVQKRDQKWRYNIYYIRTY